MGIPGPLLLLPLLQAAAAPPPSSSPRFIEDVDEVVRLVETHHPAPFGKVPRAAWLGEGRDIQEAARGGAEPADLAVRMMAWVASLGDGHTNLEPENMEAFTRWYPVRFHQFPDGLHVTGATGEGLPVNGARVLEIGGAPASEVAERQAALQGADNAFGAMEERYLLSNAGVVETLGYAAPGGPLTLGVERAGERTTVEVTPVPASFTFGWRFAGEMYGPPLSGPGSWRAWRAAYDGAGVESYRVPDPDRPPHLQYRLPYRYARVGPGGRVFHFAFNFTQDWHDVPLGTFVRQMFAAIDRVPEAELVIDLRYNSGGDGSLILPIVHEIIRRPDLDDPERLFVLTGPKTFSAAVVLVGELARHTQATFVGTPPGAPLNHYGDARDFVLPGTGMRLYVSTVYHQYGRWGDGSDVFPVDVPAPMTAEAYFAGGDPALEAVLGGEEVRPVTVIAARDGVDSARAVAERRRAEAEDLGWESWRPFPEGELTYHAVEELHRGRPESAVALLELVAESYPLSWEAHDRLGQALEEAGRTGAAIAAFRRSLELNPDNTGASGALERLGAPRGGPPAGPRSPPARRPGGPS